MSSKWRAIVRVLILALVGGIATAEVTATSDCEAHYGDGSTTAFTFSFGVWDSSELLVRVETESTGALSALTETTDYTVTLPNSDGWLSPGGTVTTTETYSTAYTLWISRVPPLTQPSDWDTADSLDLDDLEDDLDRSAVRDLYLYRLIQRCLRTSDAEVADFNLPNAVERASTTFTFDAAGEPEMVAGLVSPTDVTVSAFWHAILNDANLATSLSTLGLSSLVQAFLQDLDASEARDTISAQKKHMVDVSDYGAGAGDANDTAAIQAAIDAATAGDTIYFPRGTYNIGSALTPKASCHYVGAGRRFSLLQATSDNTDALFKFDGELSNTIWTRLGFRSSDTTGSCYVFKSTDLTNYVDNATFRDLEIFDEFHTVFYGTFAFSHWERCRIGYLGNGPYATYRHVYSGDATESLATFTNYFETCWFFNGAGSDAAVEFYSGNTLFFNSCIWQACAQPALKTSSIRNVLMVNCDFENIEPNVVDANNAMIVMAPDDALVPGNLVMQNCWVQNNGAGHSEPFLYWAYLTTSGADAKAWFRGCSGNGGNSYWTITGSSKVDLPKNTALHWCNVVNMDSSLNQTGFWGPKAYFGGGVEVSNDDDGPGFVTLVEDSDDGTDSVTLYGQALPADATMYPVYTATIDVNSAEVKALAATPAELIVEHGSGTLIEVISAVLVLDYGSEVLAEPSAPDDLAIEYDDGSGAQIATWDSTALITATADTIEQVAAGSVAAFASADNVNKNVVLINTGGEYTGNASDDTALRVIVTYRVHSSLGL